MKRFAVAHVDFDGNLTLVFVHAENPMEAAKRRLRDDGWDLPRLNSLSDVQSYVSDCDAAIEVLEV